LPREGRKGEEEIVERKGAETRARSRNWAAAGMEICWHASRAATGRAAEDFARHFQVVHSATLGRSNCRWILLFVLPCVWTRPPRKLTVNGGWGGAAKRFGDWNWR